MDDKRIRPGVWMTVVAALALLAIVVVLMESRRSSHAPQQKPPPTETLASASAPPPPASPSREPRPAARTEPAAEEPVPYIEGLVYGEIDLREARELMPDNLYWQLGSPTKDPAVLAEREAEKQRRNDEYGKVLAGDASEDEVRAYYDYKTRLSKDYLEFSEFMARRYRDSKNDQFVGMLELAMKMHAAKLAQLPAELEDALQRSREREKIREDWRRQQEEFGKFEDEPADGDE